MKKPHILIVDDDHIARAGIAFVLKNAGYEISEAFNGIRALEILENEKTPKIDAIILDRMMPEISGIEILKKIHAIPAFSNIPIIMVTVHAKQDQIKTATAYGAFDVIYKPIDETLFIQTLEKALSKDNLNR